MRAALHGADLLHRLDWLFCFLIISVLIITQKSDIVNVCVPVKGGVSGRAVVGAYSGLQSCVIAVLSRITQVLSPAAEVLNYSNFEIYYSCSESHHSDSKNYT